MSQHRLNDLPLQFWVHPGRLGRARPSLCLRHDTPREGSELLRAIEELTNATPPSRRALRLSPSHGKRSLRILDLLLSPVRDDLRVMSIRYAGEVGTIELTTVGLSLLRDAVTSWLAGAEDFGVGAHYAKIRPSELGQLDRDSGELWFWGPHYAGP